MFDGNTKVIGTPNLKITEMFAFVAFDDTGEGVVGMLTPQGWVPMVGADMARIESIRGIARQIAKDSGKEVRLLRFTNRIDMGPA
jgi:hypothetical protein